MGFQFHVLISVVLVGSFITANGLIENYYATTCPAAEKIVRQVVAQKISESVFTVPSTLRLYFHDCAVSGADASVLIKSTGSNKAERDHADNLSLSADGFDTINKAKAALMNTTTAGCSKVSCADILTIATRDAVNLAGGPYYKVELGRYDSLTSTASSVDGKLPQPSHALDRLTSIFASLDLTQTDMIALSGAHTIGFAHCSKFSNRLYGFSANSSIDPTMNKDYAAVLQAKCPQGGPDNGVDMDPVTAKRFDNWYYADLKQGKGLFTSDQVLYTDTRSRPTVEKWAMDITSFYSAFSSAMVKLGRVGVKTATNGNIRTQCEAFN